MKEIIISKDIGFPRGKIKLSTLCLLISCYLVNFAKQDSESLTFSFSLKMVSPGVQWKPCLIFNGCLFLLLDCVLESVKMLTILEQLLVDRFAGNSCR